MRKIERIILHCSDSNSEAQTALMIDEWHRARGWDKIGYHFFIRTSGLVETGRPIEEVGAHVEGLNSTSIGICLAGRDRFSDSQFESLKDILKQLKRLFPDATIHGHNEFNHGKLCPVYNVSRFSDYYKGENQWNGLTTLLRLFKQLLQLLGRSKS